MFKMHWYLILYLFSYVAQGRLENLKESVRGYGGTHTLKGLQSYENNANDGGNSKVTHKQQQNSNTEEMYSAAFDRKSSSKIPGDKEDSLLSLPATMTGTLSPRASTAPAYVKHAFPQILPPKKDYASFLPKIPGADDNYGMLFNKPETEAEKQMHELWMARRRQEAFEWKTQQHLTMVLDRLELQRSRMEADSLRK
jgi:hypothetical protein